MDWYRIDLCSERTGFFLYHLFRLDYYFYFRTEAEATAEETAEETGELMAEKLE